MTAVIDNSILNSPFAKPGRHWMLDDRGIPTGAIEQGRRRSEYIVPVPPRVDECLRVATGTHAACQM